MVDFEVGTSSLVRTWANSGTKVDTDTTLVGGIPKTNIGWQPQEKPPSQYFNFQMNQMGQKINHCLQNGIALWNATTAYASGNMVTYSNDAWLCMTGNINSAPTLLNSNWVRMTKKSELDAQALAMIKTMASPVGLPVSMPTNSTLQINAGFKIPNDARTDLIEFASNVTIDLSSGTGLNKLDTGTLTADLNYYLWILKNPSTSTVGGILSLSSTSPTLPSGMSLKALYPVDFRTETVSGDVRLVMKLLTSHTSSSFLKPITVWNANVSNDFNTPSVINLSSFFGNNAISFNASINDTGTTDAIASLYMNELSTPQQGIEVAVLESQLGMNTVTLPIGASKSYKSARANTSGDNSFAICVRDITYKGLQ